jgi:hypothetical protein
MSNEPEYVEGVIRYGTTPGTYLIENTPISLAVRLDIKNDSGDWVQGRLILDNNRLPWFLPKGEQKVFRWPIDLGKTEGRCYFKELAANY